MDVNNEKKAIKTDGGEEYSELTFWEMVAGTGFVGCMLIGMAKIEQHFHFCEKVYNFFSWVLHILPLEYNFLIFFGFMFGLGMYKLLKQ